MRRLIASALVLAAASACGPGDGAGREAAQAPRAAEPAPPAATLPAAPAPAAIDAGARAAEVFATRCAVCHGAEGRGDGPGGAALDPKPRNYRDAAWQAGVSDERIRRTILEGGSAVGKSAAMPPHPDLAAQPEVLAALVAKIRGFGGSR